MVNEHCVCVCVCVCACVSVLVKMSSNCEPQPNQGQRLKLSFHPVYYLITFDQSEKQYKIDMEGVWCCPFSSEACICIIMLTA